MGWTVDKSRTHTRPVENDESEKATVEIVKLDQGDKQDLYNLLTKISTSSQQAAGQTGGNKKSRAKPKEYGIGDLEASVLRRVLRTWTLPAELNDHTLNRLDPFVGQQIVDHAKDISPFLNDILGAGDAMLGGPEGENGQPEEDGERDEDGEGDPT